VKHDHVYIDMCAPGEYRLILARY